MIKNVGKFSAAMAKAEEINKKSIEAMRLYKLTGDTKYLDAAEDAAEEYNQYQYFSVSHGLI